MELFRGMMTEIADALAELGARFHGVRATLAEIGDADAAAPPVFPHAGISPLGLWAPLALLAGAAGARNGHVTPSPGRAREVLFAMMRNPHPGARLSVSLSLSREVDDERLVELLGDVVDAGQMASHGIPSPRDLARWATDRTDGQMTALPLHVDEDATLVAGVSVAAAGRWASPLEACWAGSLGDAWSVDRVVRAGGPDCGLARDEDLGYLGVTVNRCGNGLFALSVIAAPQVSASAVTAAAGRLARRFGAGERILLPNARLPVGDHGWWRVDDNPLFAGSVEQQHNCALIPSWVVAETYDIMTYGLGYWGVLAEALSARLGPSRGAVCAGQASQCWFGRDGFAATALTAAQISGSSGWPIALPAERLDIVSGSAPSPVGGTLVELEYRHPFAVVVATASEAAGHVWRGLVIHVVWVTRACEP